MSPSQNARTDSAKPAAKAASAPAPRKTAARPKSADRGGAERRAALAAQFIPASAAVLELTEGGAWLQRQLPPACSYQSVRPGAALPSTAAKADIVVMLDGLDGVADPDGLFAQLARTPKPIVLSYRPRDLAEESGQKDGKAATGQLAFYDLTRLFDRHGLRIEATAPLGGGEMIMRLAPAARIVPVAGARIAVVAGRDTFGERLGLQVLMSVLPGDAEVQVFGFAEAGRAGGGFDLTVIGAGTGLLQPLHSDAVFDLVSRSRAAVGIFGTQRRELVVRTPVERLVERLDAWFARDEDDLALYGRGIRRAVHLGDWLIAPCPLTTATEDEPLDLSAAALREMGTDRALDALRGHRHVTAGERGALLCALTAAETVTWREDPGERLPGAAGEVRGLLMDVFGRGYPEGEAFLVERDAVRRYRARVMANVAALQARIAALLGRHGAMAAA
jgi:hypothetical protein